MLAPLTSPRIHPWLKCSTWVNILSYYPLLWVAACSQLTCINIMFFLQGDTPPPHPSPHSCTHLLGFGQDGAGWGAHRCPPLRHGPPRSAGGGRRRGAGVCWGRQPGQATEGRRHVSSVFCGSSAENGETGVRGENSAALRRRNNTLCVSVLLTNLHLLSVTEWISD